ncbi:hypothetical protein Lfu02_12370 [Longispora fulva]|uniref:LasA protease n=1 Tax=Longispora fulva TaxID=619741 RepID=A0A8J7GFE8_9ACTN|nr:M23 family metallopeptidase [Longispora fulva]MBG6134903.1 LasA protease [Longispora fulva]GIG56865.1 hypothetical protein Lfu02_12370 [Longispora fulva]
MRHLALLATAMLTGWLPATLHQSGTPEQAEHQAGATEQAERRAPGTGADLGAVVGEHLLAARGARHGTPLVEIRRTTGDAGGAEAGAGWAFGSATLPVPDGVDGTPDSALFVAHGSATRWEVGLEGTPAFARLAGRAPATVLRPEERAVFAAGSPAGPVDTGLELPWARGDSWYMGGGPHGNDGTHRPFSSADFTEGPGLDGRVLAAGPGLVYRSCERDGGALVKVVHDNGYTTTYYHMRDLGPAADGARVDAGAYLGHTGTQLPCGGQATGPHVHFTLWRSAPETELPLDGRTIGGWTFHEGRNPYDGYAERRGLRVDRTGGTLTNHGPTPGTPPTTTPATPPATVPTTPPTVPGTPPTVPGTPPAVPGVPAESGLVRVTAPGFAWVPLYPSGFVMVGQDVRVVCATRGTVVAGVRGPTDVWVRLDDTRWISEAYLAGTAVDLALPGCP